MCQTRNQFISPIGFADNPWNLLVTITSSISHTEIDQNTEMKQEQTDNTTVTFSNYHTYKPLLLCSGSQTSHIFHGFTIFVDLEATLLKE